MGPGRLKNGKVVARRQVVGLRLWLFRITAIAIIPATFLILVEVCLRMTGFGYPASAIIKHEIGGRQVCINNLKFGWRFFPKKIARETSAFVFPAIKSPQTYRIFVLGGSAAMGTPEPPYGFSRILKVLLVDAYQSLKFEVIDVGMPAINSHGVLEIARDCAHYEPDLFIVYLGNNEVTGPYGVGTVFAPLSPSLAFIRASIAIKSTKLGQLIERLSSSLPIRHKHPIRWGGLQMFLKNQVRFDSPGLQHVYKHFESNLTDICGLGRQVGAKVIVCNVATNLKDCPPFASLHNPELKQADETMWSKIYNQAVQLESDGRYAEALEHHQSAVEIDGQFAEAHFRMGRCYWMMGRYNQARDSYIRARNLDTLRFRADERINEIVRLVAQKAGKEVSFVDVVTACRGASPYNTPGKELFYEHVHFNFKGNYLLACTVFDKVEKTILEQRGVKRAPDGAMLSKEDCAARLALTGWDRLAVARVVLNGFIKNPPFTNQAYHDECVRDMEEQVKNLRYYEQPSGVQESLSQYRQALKWHPFDWQLRRKYGQFLRDAIGDNEAAISQFAMVLRELPHCYVYSELSAMAFKQGRTNEGIKMARRALEMKPLDAQTHCDLAQGLQKKGQLKSALECYSNALEIEPAISDQVYGLMAQAFHSIGEGNKATEILRDGIKIFPRSADLHCGLGIFLKEQGKTNEAAQELRVALSIQPDYLLAQKALMELNRKNKQK
jgi:tetratricopeptide (TPR) repeat protein